jgi:hypothetical protein
MSGREYRLSIWQDGQEQASVWGGDWDRVYFDAMHYAFVYGQDGPTQIHGIPADKMDAVKAKLSRVTAT